MQARARCSASDTIRARSTSDMAAAVARLRFALTLFGKYSLELVGAGARALKRLAFGFDPLGERVALGVQPLHRVYPLGLRGGEFLDAVVTFVKLKPVAIDPRPQILALVICVAGFRPCRL